MESMFPDQFPPKPPKPKPPWRPTRDCKTVLAALANGPRSEDELFVQLKGDMTPQRIDRAMDALAKNGYVRDTGRRSKVWRNGGRCWVWELVTDAEASTA